MALIKKLFSRKNDVNSDLIKQLNKAIRALPKCNEKHQHCVCRTELKVVLEREIQLFGKNVVSHPNADLTSLNLEVLSLILKRLPAQELMKLCSVCWSSECGDCFASPWMKFIKSILARRRTLKLFLSSEPNEAIRQYVFSVVESDSEDCEYLALKPVGRDDELFISEPDLDDSDFCTLLQRIFPQLEELAIGCPVDTCDVTCLLSKWPNLTTLVFCSTEYYIFHSLEDSNLTRLATQINSLLSLKRLDLFSSRKELLEQLGPTLNRLEHFAVGIPTSFEDECITAIRLLNPAVCSSLFLRTDQASAKYNLNRVLEVSPQLVANLTELRLRYLTTRNLRFISEHFVSLKYLSLHFPMQFYLSWTELEALSKLSQLTELKMDNCFWPHEEELTEKRSITVLPTVTTLHIMSLHISRDDAENLTELLAKIFPNLERLLECTIKRETVFDYSTPKLKQFWNAKKNYRESVDNVDDVQLFGRHKQLFKYRDDN